MTLPLEAVPNFSEGRDRSVIEAIGAALAADADCSTSTPTPTTTDQSSRSSATSARSSTRCLPASRSRASRSTCATHAGVHPRIGAADVVPIVPIRPADAERASAAALELAERVGNELALPVFLYADSR